MKKSLALLLAVVMAFSVMLVPVAAETEEATEERTTKYSSVGEAATGVYEDLGEGDYIEAAQGAFEFCEKLFVAIHNLIHNLSVAFEFDCPLCGATTSDDATEDEATTAPTEPEDTTDPSEPEDTTDPTDPSEPADPDEFEDEPIDPNFPAKPVFPEDAIYVESVEGADAAIANAKSGDYIVLADGLYDEIVVTKSNITIAARNAKVGFLNLNAKSNVKIIGLTFIADYAEQAVKPNSTALSGVYTNIVGTQTPNKADAHDIVIKDCKFVGEKSGAYAPIYFNDQKRNNGTHAYNVTIDGCYFDVSATYYVYLNYLVDGAITIKNNIFGGKNHTCDGMFWGSSNGSDLVVENNKIYNWMEGACIGASRSGAAYDLTVKVRKNTFIQVADGATNTNYVHLKNYKITDTFDIVNSLNTFKGAITNENAWVNYENLV